MRYLALLLLLSGCTISLCHDTKPAQPQRALRPHSEPLLCECIDGKVTWLCDCDSHTPYLGD